MSQTASFLTDYLFPGLLIGCGCLGLAVVNSIAHRQRCPQRRDHHGAKARPAAPSTMARGRPPAAPARGAAQGWARVAPLHPTRHRLVFGKGQARVTDAERERLRIFLAAAKLGPGARVAVVGHGEGRQGQQQARRLAALVVALLRQLGVAAASIAEPEVAPDGSDAGGRAVTIVIRKR